MDDPSAYSDHEKHDNATVTALNTTAAGRNSSSGIAEYNITKLNDSYLSDNQTADLFEATKTMSGHSMNDSHPTSSMPDGHHMETDRQISNHQIWSDIVLPKMDNLADIFTFGCSMALIFGGLVPYIPQYIKIKNSGSSDGFSTYVCLTLLLANILRIAFWFGHRFELPLLVQSFVMIAGMMALMEICVRVRNRTTAYVIPSVRTNPSRTRRSFIGKIINRFSNDTVTDSDHQNGLNNESTPIYSVTAPNLPTSGESALLPFVASSSISTGQHQVPSSEIKSYHQQESINIETSIPAAGVQPSNDTDDLGNINSFRDNESPILDNISIEPESPQTSSDSMPSPTGHSYANGYLATHDHKRSALVKWLNSHYFWDWDDLFSYIKFLSYFTLILSMLTYMLIDNYLYIETLGYVALFTEAILGMPQLTRNFQKKSTLGMSVHMVIMWLSGDLFKTLYYVLRKLPAQFVVCGSIQVVVDILILTQVFWYMRPKVTYRKLPKLT